MHNSRTSTKWNVSIINTPVGFLLWQVRMFALHYALPLILLLQISSCRQKKKKGPNCTLCFWKYDPLIFKWCIVLPNSNFQDINPTVISYLTLISIAWNTLTLLFHVEMAPAEKVLLHIYNNKKKNPNLRCWISLLQLTEVSICFLR